MSEFDGKFVWYELMTTAPVAAGEFYASVVGWSVKDSGLSDRNYSILSMGERGVGGLMELPPAARDAGARPGWSGYIAVDDIDGVVERIKAAGGAIHRAPDDIPGIGRFAMAADPQGAIFVLFKPLNSDGAPSPAPPQTPGHVGWHELHAAEWEAAFGFYSHLFGWTKDNAVDMGPMGIYQLFAIDGVQAGGMMTKTPTFPAPVWIYYFNVDEINAAVSRVKSAGGQIVNGPHEVPGGSWIAQCLDPQGAMFAMVGPHG